MNPGVHSWVLFSVPLILSGFTSILRPLFLAANSDIVAILTKAGDGNYMNLQLTNDRGERYYYHNIRFK